MNHFLYEAGLWIILIVECFFALIVMSFVLFGGKFAWSIELRGPLRFLSASNKRDGAEVKQSSD